MGENVRQGDEKAKNLKQSLTMYHKRKEMAGEETLTDGPERSSMYCNGS